MRRTGPAPPRTARIVIGNPGSSAQTLTPDQAGIASAAATVMAGVVVPEGTRAVRLCFSNCGPAPATVGGFSVCPSAAWGDYANPTGPGPWRRGTFNYGGARGALPVNLAANQVLSAELPGNGGTVTDPGLVTKWMPGTDTAARYTFSDVLPVDTLPRTDGGPGRLLFVRVLWPQGATVSQQLSSGGTSLTGLYAGHGTSCCRVAGDRLAGDVVSGATPVGGLPFAWMECFSVAPGHTIVAGGDSQIQGFDNAFYLQAAYALSTAEHPLGVVNAAWGGTRPNNWLKHPVDTCDALSPSLVLVEGFSGNDNLETVSAAAYAEGARFQIARILALRDYLPPAVPMVVTTPMPRNYGDAAIVAAWRAARPPLLALDCPSMRVLDVTPACEDPAAPGQWRAGFGDSYGLHATNACQIVMADLFRPMLAELLGIGGNR